MLQPLQLPGEQPVDCKSCFIHPFSAECQSGECAKRGKISVHVCTVLGCVHIVPEYLQGFYKVDGKDKAS